MSDHKDRDIAEVIATYRRHAEKAEARFWELEADRARWEARASFLIAECVHASFLIANGIEDPTADDSNWILELDDLILREWPNSIRAAREDEKS